MLGSTSVRVNRKFSTVHMPSIITCRLVFVQEIVLSAQILKCSVSLNRFRVVKYVGRDNYSWLNTNNGPYTDFLDNILFVTDRTDSLG
jgi:hypothetical protein